jgi:hypothetical protein
MILPILGIFCLTVIIIGLATAKLNAKGPCDHHWVETEEGDIKCTKCYRMIRHVQDMSQTELDTKLLKSQDEPVTPLRPEGIKKSTQVFSDAG